MVNKVVAVVSSAVACSVAAALVYRLLTVECRWRSAKHIIRQFGKQSTTPVHKLLKLADAMVEEMRAGLTSEGVTKLKMLISNVESLPTGDEEGEFYGVDLCGTKLCFSRVVLGGKNKRVLKQESLEVPISCNLMVGSSKELFDFVAIELVKFISTEDESFRVPNGRQKHLGFTFSFPIDQDSESLHTHIEWTRGFSIKDSVGKDMVSEVNEAMKRNGVDMRVSALVNDTVGTLAGGRYFNNDAVAAVILGTGTNAAYVDNALEIPKSQGPLPLSGEMVINIEWGNFNSPHLPITDIDVSLDAESSNPGQEMFAKLISGVHLGEILRRILLKIAEDAALFGETVPPKLRMPFILRTTDLAAMHQDTSKDLDMVGEKMKDILGISDSTPVMRKAVVMACQLIAERSARLAGAGIVAILKKIQRNQTKQRTVVAIDGGLYEHYRLYREYLHNSIIEMLGRETANNVIIEHASDRSGIGAALLAASYYISTLES